MDPSSPDYRELVRQVAYEQAKLSTSAFFFDGQDRLRVRSFGSVAGAVLSVEARFLGAEGRLQAFQRTHTPASDRTIATTLEDLGEGFLLGIQVRASTGTPRIGQVFVLLDIVRGAGATVQQLATIWSGYITDTSSFGWPGNESRSSVDGPGVMRSITGSVPAAGAEISEAVPTNARWRPRSLRFTLTTSATVATRIPTLTVDDGANFYGQYPPGLGIVAANTGVFAFGASVGRFADLSITAIASGFPTELTMMGGHRLRTGTVNLQVGDQYSAPQMLIEEWIED